ncbi:het domain [Apiospora sp. TS-2023a]
MPFSSSPAPWESQLWMFSCTGSLKCEAARTLWFQGPATIIDHLPTPIDGRTPVVPFFAETRSEHNWIYNPKDFHNIPGEYGFKDFENLLDSGLHSSDQEMELPRMNQFLQSWLFFALLSRVLKRTVHVRDWYKEKDRTSTTDKLNRVLNEWKDEWDNQRDESQEAAFSADDYVQASMALENARRFVGKHLAHRQYDHDDGQEEYYPPGSAGDPQDQVNRLVVLSITSVAEVLQDRLWTRIPTRQMDRIMFWKQPEDEERHCGYSKWCRKQMEDEKWCPFEIRRLEATMLRTNSIYYSCQIKRDRPNLDHVSAGCTMWQCKAKHAGSHEQFTALHMIDDSTLIQIIDRGDIPLVRYTYQGKMTCKGYSLADDGNRPKFLALSHSWNESTLHCGNDARGGNNREMLDCQLSKLRKAYTKICNAGDDADGLFWVDVFCLLSDYKKKMAQLNQLHVIYSQAKAVQIWDRNLLGRPKGPQSKTVEMNVRVRTGEWALRLWTLPEAVLAKRLCVSFQDGLLDMDEVIEARELARKKQGDKFHLLWRTGHPFSSSIWHLRTSSDQKVQRACEAVQFRLATKPEDETIVLCSILKLDISRLFIHILGPYQPGLEQVVQGKSRYD